MNSAKLLAILVCCLAAVQSKKAIPDYLHVCKRSDPEVGSCIKNSVEFLRPKLAQGIAELQVPPIEPLYIKELTAIDSRNINVLTRDLYVKGCSQFDIKSIRADTQNGVYETILTYPKLIINGQYLVNGTILLLPIRGEGKMDTVIRNSSAKVVMRSEIVDEENEKRLKWTSMDMDIAVASGKLHLYNLFNGDKTLGDVVNLAINTNFNHFFRELKPMIEKVLSNFLLETANKMVQGFDYDDIFPV